MANEPPPAWQATVRPGPGSPVPYADFLEQDAQGISVFEDPGGGWVVTALYRTRPDAGQIGAALALIAASAGEPEPALEIAPLPASDWLAEAYAGFPARRLGRFHIYGSHIAALPPPGALPLKVDAATAFGSGEHATTEGCLLALAAERRRRPRLRRGLDMGTGSGILAIAIARLWQAADIIAIDVDPESARVAAANARANRATPRIRVRAGDGYHAPLARTGPRFDVIVSNILARPLARMAPALARRLAPGGTAILAGLLRRQQATVLSAHRTAGLKLAARRPIGEWQILVLKKPYPGRSRPRDPK